MVAGVIGTSKFIYDLWGDTVNVASRLESVGQPGSVRISESTRSYLGDRFAISAEESIELKGKGPTRTWLVTPAGG